jgi:hypothetical protein
MRAYANGQRYVSKNGPERECYSDPDATWGHRSAVSTRKGGGFYGYRLHASICTATDLPVVWTVATAREHESTFVASLLDTVRERGFAAKPCALDKVYDNGRVYRRLSLGQGRSAAPADPRETLVSPLCTVAVPQSSASSAVSSMSGRSPRSPSVDSTGFGYTPI